MPLHSADPAAGGRGQWIIRCLLRHVPAYRIVWILAGLLPILLFAAVMLLLFTTAQERVLERSLLEAAAGAAHAVDRAIGEQIGLLEGLAASRALDRGEFGGFRLDAERLWAQHPEWRTLILTDANHAILNLRFHAGTPLPALRDPVSLARVWTTHRPSVGDLTNGQVAFRVPVLRDGHMVYTLAAPTTPRLFRDALRAHPRPLAPAALLVGTDGVVIAATPEAPVPEGVPLPDTLGRATLGGVHAVGTQYAASDLVGSVGWRVLVFASVATIRQPLLLMRTAVVCGGLLAAGLTLTLVLALSTAWAARREATRLRAELVERTRVEAAIQGRLQAEERLSRLAGAVPGVLYIFRMRPDGSVSLPYASPAIEEIFGLQLEALTADAGAIFHAIHPDDVPRFQASIQESARQCTPWQEEFRVRHPRKGEIWIEGRSAPEREADGGILWHGFVHDITARKQADQALRASEERFRRAMDATNDGLWEWDVPTGRMYYSPAYLRMLSYTPEGWAVIDHAWVDLVHPEDRDRVLAANRACIDNRQPTFEVEFRMRAKDGTWRGILRRGEAVLRDSAGRALRLIGTHVDITERQRAEAALRDSETTAVALARENAIMAEIGRLVSSTLAIDEVYERFAAEVRKLLPWDRIVISTIDLEQRTVRNVYIAGDGLSDRNVRDAYPLEGSGHAEMVHTQAPLLIQTDDFTAYAERFPRLVSTFRAGYHSILNVPLVSKGRIIGALLLRSRAPDAYTTLVACAERIAAQIAGAIANAQLYAERGVAEAELAARTAQLEAVRGISMEITRELDLTVLLQLIVARATQLVRAASGTCFLWDAVAERLVPQAWIGYGEWRADIRPRLGEGLAGQVAQRREGLLTANYPAEPYAVPEAVARKPLRAVMGEPLLYRDRLIGALVIDHELATPGFTPQDQEVLRLFAAPAAIAIENARLFAGQQRAAGEARSLYEVAHRLTTSLDPLEVLHLIAEKTTVLLGTPHAQVVLWDEPAQALRLGAAYGSEAAQAQAQVFHLGEGVNGIVAQSRAPLVVNDYQAFSQRVPELTHVVADMAVPLLYQGRLLGVLNTHTTQPGAGFSDTDLALLMSFAAQAAIALENARLFGELEQAMADIHRAQAELIRAETLHALGQMAAGIAHDLNNTLAAILGQVELQKLRATDAAAQEGLALLETAAVDGAHIVQRLLNFARPKGTTALGPVDLAAVVRDAVQFAQPRWKDEPERRGLTIHVTLDLPTTLPLVQGHAAELREAITNLLFNAVDAMPQGGTLTVTARADADTVTLAIQDTGVGMPPEVQARLFEPFFTTKGPRGTGLGLAGVYGIMARHGGRIAVTSMVGQGTTVTLSLCPATTTGGQGNGVHAPAAPPPRRRILVVDDEALVRTTLGALLRAIGHTVIEAADGASALRVLDEAAPEIVVTDLGMPEMNGWELATRIKACHPTLPVVLLTGWQDQAPAGPTARQAVDLVLGKPVRLEVLRKAIGDLAVKVHA